MANFEVYKSSFESLDKLKDALKSAADKNKVSAVALILLLALNNSVDLSFLIKEDALAELINYGFVQNENGILKVTGKGAILAKSLERIV